MNTFEDSGHKFLFSYRFFVICLALYSYILWQMTSLGIGFALVCMVPKDADSHVNSTDKLDDYDLQWSKSEQSTVLSAFLWGGMISMLPSGVILDKYGCKRILFIAYIILGILTMATPITAVKLGAWGVSASRFVMGFVSAVQIPAIMKICEAWVSPAELGISLSIAYCGAGTGSLVLYFVSGFLCSSSVGWPMIFYFIGILQMIFWTLWTIFFSDKPDQCRFIGEQEMKYLEDIKDHRRKSTTQHKFKVPWKQIISSKPVLASVLANIFQSFLSAFFSFYVPQYLRDCLGLHVQENGIFSALPFLAQIIFRFFSGFLADKIEVET